MSINKTGDWRIADWTNKNDETVGESKFPQLTEVDMSFKTEAVPKIKLVDDDWFLTEEELNIYGPNPFTDYETEVLQTKELN